MWEEVKNKLKKPATCLSGGQQQCLCIGRALALRPPVLLMDEPTTNLDPVNAAKIEELIRKLSRETTIIIVTHDPEQAKRVANRGAIVFKGKIVEENFIDRLFTVSYYELIQKLTMKERMIVEALQETR